MRPANNTMHSDGQGRGVYSFYQVWCLIAFYKCPFTLSAGDGALVFKQMIEEEIDG